MLAKLFLRHVRVAGGYVVQHHSQACTTDTMLATVSECSSAQSELDPDAADVTSESRADTPKGCSLYKGKWYFNSHATGKLDGESEPICQQGNIQSDTTYESNRSYIRA